MSQFSTEIQCTVHYTVVSTYRLSLEKDSDQLIVALYTLSIYPSVHNQLIRTEARPVQFFFFVFFYNLEDICTFFFSGPDTVISGELCERLKTDISFQILVLSSVHWKQEIFKSTVIYIKNLLKPYILSFLVVSSTLLIFFSTRKMKHN